jgi:choline dehydrogenase-like flavoprotein
MVLTSGVWTTSAANSVAMLPLHEFSNRTDDLVSVVQRQNPAQFLPNAHPTLVAGVKEQFKYVLRSIKAGSIAFSEYANGQSPALSLVLQKPFSRVSVSINSTNPFDDPIVDFGVYTNPVDIEIVVDMFKSWRKLLTMPSWVELGAIETFPGNNVTTNEEILAYIRENSVPTIAHPCCTAAMMPQRLGGVVDSSLKVYGVNNLRVVDASIMPIVPSSPLTSTVYAVAEKVTSL